MKNKLLLLVLICFMSWSISSCNVDAEDLGLGDASADDLILPSFTLMSLASGEKTGEKIAGENLNFLSPWRVLSWSPENGDLFFWRGNVVGNDYYYDEAVYGQLLAIVPLEPEFYWNGVGLYYNGFLYKITSTEDGLRIYNQGLWTIGGHCLIVHASSSLDLPENEINAGMMSKIHKVKVKRGHLKKEKMNHNLVDSFTPPGLADRFYSNQGKKIRPDTAGEYVRAEDFIEKTDGENGYFQSSTPDLKIKKVYLRNEKGIDCSKVY